ncbi:MAG: CBS domain-containing protein, partial [Candidatus Omnitrophota bacterium]
MKTKPKTKRNIVLLVFFCALPHIAYSNRLAEWYDSLFASYTEQIGTEKLIKLAAIAFLIIYIIFYLANKLSSRYNKTKVLDKIYLHEVMSKDPCRVELEDTLNDAARLFRKHNIRHLPVVSEGRILKGIITKRDMLRIIPSEGEDNISQKTIVLEHFPIEKVMAKEVAALRPHDSLKQAIKLLADNNYGCIPIVNEAN